MGNSSPTSLMFGGIIVASMSFKLKENYIYFSYAAVVIGFIMFVIGVVKYFQQRNRYW